MIYKLY